MSDDKKIKTNEQLSTSINKITALAEAFFDLKANVKSNRLIKVEDGIANLRKYYNVVVRIYNDKVDIL